MYYELIKNCYIGTSLFSFKHHFTHNTTYNIEIYKIKQWYINIQSEKQNKVSNALHPLTGKVILLQINDLC